MGIIRNLRQTAKHLEFSRAAAFGKTSDLKQEHLKRRPHTRPSWPLYSHQPAERGLPFPPFTGEEVKQVGFCHSRSFKKSDLTQTHMGWTCKRTTNRESHITNFPPTFLTHIQIIHHLAYIQIIYFSPNGPTLVKHVLEKVASIYSPSCNFCHFQILLIITETLKTHKKLTIS